MALDNYAALQIALSAWLDGSDFAGREADFIALAEAEISARLASGIDQGRMVRPMMERLPVTIDDEYVDMPNATLVLPISFAISGLDRPWTVRYVSPEILEQMKYATCEGEASSASLTGSAAPSHYTIVGTKFQFFPAPDQDYAGEFKQFSRVPSLSDDVTTNWLLSAHPNVYLYSALAQAEMFGWADGRMANFATMAANAVDGALASYPVPVSQAALTSGIPTNRSRYDWRTGL